METILDGYQITVVGYASGPNHNIDRKIRAIIKLITKSTSTINYDTAYPAPAAINMDTNVITFNPNLITQCVCSAFEKEIDADSNIIQDCVLKVKTFLVLHELGHYLYSPSIATSDKYIKRYITHIYPDIPEDFIHLIMNVVEDSHIQAHLIKDFNSPQYTDIMLAGEKWEQGVNTISKIQDAIKNGKIGENDYYQLLFYFILRAYNPNNIVIHNLFDRKDLFRYKADTLAAFDKAIKCNNTSKRCEITTREVIPLIYRDIFTKDNQPKPQPIPPTPPIGPDGPEGEGGSGNGPTVQIKPENMPKPTDKELKELEKAAEELLKRAPKSLTEGRKDKQEKIDENIKNGHGKMAGILADCEYKPICGEFGINLSDRAAHLLAVYDAAISKLYNISHEFETRLADGEVDEDIVSEWFTEKNINIFSQDTKLVEDKRIKVTFVIDHSGSMSGIWNSISDISIALIHAFENNNIQTQVIMFDDKSVQIKKFTDIASLNGLNSNIALLRDMYSPSGGTDPKPALELVSTDGNTSENEINLLFLITDGCICRAKEVKNIINLLKIQKYYTLGIGLKLDYCDLETLRSVQLDEVIDYQKDNYEPLGDTIMDIVMNKIKI